MAGSQTCVQWPRVCESGVLTTRPLNRSCMWKRRIHRSLWCDCAAVCCMMQFSYRLRRLQDACRLENLAFHLLEKGWCVCVSALVHWQLILYKHNSVNLDIAKLHEVDTCTRSYYRNLSHSAIVLCQWSQCNNVVTFDLWYHMINVQKYLVSHR